METSAIRTLADEYFEYLTETNPTEAHMRGDYRYGVVYWHAPASEPVFQTDTDACVRLSTLNRIPDLMQNFDAALMCCEANIQHPSRALINNIEQRTK